MFSYSPTPDRSGEIMAAGTIGAAQSNAQMGQLGQDIGGALMSIAGAYKGYSDMKSSIKSGEKMLDVLGPAIGMTTEKLKTLGYNDMDDRSKAMFFDGIFGGGNYATAAQARNFGLGFGQRQNAPYVEAGLKNQQNIAGGNVPHGGMGVPRPPSGMGSVEPDLPVADEDLPAVNAPAAVAPMQIPGGDESMRRYKEWKSKRGY
jgi:hypothetical protein